MGLGPGIFDTGSGKTFFGSVGQKETVSRILIYNTDENKHLFFFDGL
jgi:hypothetical protein